MFINNLAENGGALYIFGLNKLKQNNILLIN